MEEFFPVECQIPPTQYGSPVQHQLMKVVSVTFTVTTTNVNNGTKFIYYSINPVSGSINSSDFSSGTTGSFTVNSNSGSISIGIANDTTTESGSDVFNLRIHTGSTGLGHGPIAPIPSYQC